MPYILLGESAFRKYQTALSNYGFTPVCLPPDQALNKTVADHADTLVFSDGYVFMANEEYCSLLDKRAAEKITPVSERPIGNYPTDTVFNALRIGKFIFARWAGLAPSVKRYSEKCGLNIVNVNQGYARCSTLALAGAQAAITADEGMANALISAGIDVLRIRPSHIALNGCKYGFIGGASFVWEPRCCRFISNHSRYVYFFGDIRRHPDNEAITDFISGRGYEIASLGGELTDVGGAIVLE